MRIEILGCEVDNLSMDETVVRVEEFVCSNRPHQHVVVNADKIVKAAKDPRLRSIINGCDLINVDGMSVVWASRMLGKPLKERIAGVDLFERLLKRAAEKNWRVYFLGARQEVVSRVAELASLRFPGIKIAGYTDGYWKPEEETDVVKDVQSTSPQLLFVAISSPKKEQFLGRYQERMGVPFSMGVGGTFDVFVGKVKRAPLWMQRYGLEWFYRFLQEPKRMFKRYFIDDMYFVNLLIRELLLSRQQPN